MRCGTTREENESRNELAAMREWLLGKWFASEVSLVSEADG